MSLDGDQDVMASIRDNVNQMWIQAYALPSLQEIFNSQKIRKIFFDKSTLIGLFLCSKIKY